MGKYIDHRLVARPELDNTLWTDNTCSSNQSQRRIVEAGLRLVLKSRRKGFKIITDPDSKQKRGKWANKMGKRCEEVEFNSNVKKGIPSWRDDTSGVGPGQVELGPDVARDFHPLPFTAFWKRGT